MAEAAKTLFLILSAFVSHCRPLGGPSFSVHDGITRPVRKELSWQIAVNSFFLPRVRILPTYIRASSISIPIGKSRWTHRGFQWLVVAATGQLRPERKHKCLAADPYRDCRIR